MHAWTRELLAHLESGREDLRAAVAETPVAARERRPSPSAWSVAEVLSHLARTEGQIAALLQKRSRPLLDDAASRPLAGEGSVAPRFDSAPVLDRGERLAAPAFAAPDPGASLEQAVRKLERARALQLSDRLLERRSGVGRRERRRRQTLSPVEHRRAVEARRDGALACERSRRGVVQQRARALLQQRGDLALGPREVREHLGDRPGARARASLARCDGGLGDGSAQVFAPALQVRQQLSRPGVHGE